MEEARHGRGATRDHPHDEREKRWQENLGYGTMGEATADDDAPVAKTATSMSGRFAAIDQRGVAEPRTMFQPRFTAHCANERGRQMLSIVRL